MANTKRGGTTLYPIKNRWVHDAPYGVHVADQDADVAGLIESGAFSDDPAHPDIDSDAPDLTVPPVVPDQIPGVPVEPPAEVAPTEASVPAVVMNAIEPLP